MQTSAQLNNVGTLRLGEGKFDEAIKELTKSLRCAKNVVSDVGFPRKDEAKDIQSSTDSLLGKRLTTCVSQVPVQNLLRSTRAPNSQWKGLCLLSIRLLEEEGCDCHTAAIDASAAIIYNMALAYQLQATFGTSSAVDVESLNLNRSLMLYEMAYKICMDSDETRVSFDLIMAIVNNLGHIHSRLGNETSANECFQHLLSVMMFLRSTNDYDCEINPAFQHSTSYLVLREIGAPAA